MSRTCVLVLYGLSLTVVEAHAQTTSHDDGTEYGQSNLLMGWPVWLTVAAIVSAALLYTFGARRRRSRK